MNSTTGTAENRGDGASRLAIALTIASGVALLALLPAGIFLGISGVSFAALAVLHGILQVAALITTLLFLRTCGAERGTVLMTALVTITAAAALYLLGAVPITARDALIHHLAVGKWWVQNGSITEIPWHEWSYYPMLVDLGFTALERFGAAWATPYYHATFLFLLAGAVAIFLRRAGRSGDECCAGFCITLTIPIAFNLATIPVVDLGLALYTMTAITAIHGWIEERRVTWIVAAGVSLGLALGTKYNGILAVGVLLPLTIIFGIRSGRSQGRVLAGVGVIGAIAAIVFAPWGLKDFLWTGNPIYPLFNGLFNVSGPPSAARGLTPLELRTMLYGESWLDLLLTPFRMLYLGIDEDPRRFDGVLSPILVMALFSLRSASRKPWVIYLMLIAVLYFVLSQIYAAPRVRYLAPIYGPLAVLTTVGIFEAAELFRKRKGLILGALLSIQLLWFGRYLKGLLERTEAVPFAAGRISGAEYYRKHLIEYPVIEFINSSIPHGSRVYLLFTGNRFYLYDRDVRSAGHNSGNEILLMLRGGASPADLKAEFRRRGITHIEANTELLGRALGEQASEAERRVWAEFVRGLTVQLEHGSFVVWAL